MNKTSSKQKLKVIFLLQLSLSLPACFPPDKWEQEWEQERLQKFNQRNAPEYQIIDKVLYVDWKADNRTHAQALKLKVPMSYLQGGIGSDGRIGQILSTGGAFGYSRPKDPNEKQMIDSIDFEISEKGQPVILDKDGYPSNKEDIYGFSLSSHSSIGHPVNRVERYGPSMESENLFRAKDINSLQNYKQLSCYDIDQLKEHVKSKRDGYVGAQLGLELLANKLPDDPTPKNCLSNEHLQYWISPPEVPEDEAVGIYCGGLYNCVINFVYKSRGVAIITRKNRLHVIPKWQTYRQQVIKTIQQFETQ